MVFIMSLVISIFFLLPIKVSGVILETTPEDWYDYITQFDDGYVTATIEIVEEWDTGSHFAVFIIDAPGIEFDGYYIHYVASYQDYRFQEHFNQLFRNTIHFWLLIRVTNPEYTLADAFSESEIDFDGIIYWNFEEKCWQIESYGEDEPDYFEQLYVKLVPAVITVITFASVLSMLVFKRKEQ